MVVLALEPASHLDKVHFLFDVRDGLSHLNIVEVKRVTEAAQDVVIIHEFGDSGSSFRSMCAGFKDASSILYFLMTEHIMTEDPSFYCQASKMIHSM